MPKAYGHTESVCVWFFVSQSEQKTTADSPCGMITVRPRDQRKQLQQQQ